MLSLQSSEMERYREYRHFGIAEDSIPLNNRAYSEEEAPARRHTQPASSRQSRRPALVVEKWPAVF
jgi:hypothetical protein